MLTPSVHPIPSQTQLDLARDNMQTLNSAMERKHNELLDFQQQFDRELQAVRDELSREVQRHEALMAQQQKEHDGQVNTLIGENQQLAAEVQKLQTALRDLVRRHESEINTMSLQSQTLQDEAARLQTQLRSARSEADDARAAAEAAASQNMLLDAKVSRIQRELESMQSDRRLFPASLAAAAAAGAATGSGDGTRSLSSSMTSRGLSAALASAGAGAGAGVGAGVGARNGGESAPADALEHLANTRETLRMLNNALDAKEAELQALRATHREERSILSDSVLRLEDHRNQLDEETSHLRLLRAREVKTLLEENQRALEDLAAANAALRTLRNAVDEKEGELRQLRELYDQAQQHMNTTINQERQAQRRVQQQDAQLEDSRRVRLELDKALLALQTAETRAQNAERNRDLLIAQQRDELQRMKAQYDEALLRAEAERNNAVRDIDRAQQNNIILEGTVNEVFR